MLFSQNILTYTSSFSPYISNFSDHFSQSIKSYGLFSIEKNQWLKHKKQLSVSNMGPEHVTSYALIGLKQYSDNLPS
jgi:hypothetical protein